MRKLVLTDVSFQPAALALSLFTFSVMPSIVVAQGVPSLDRRPSISGGTPGLAAPSRPPLLSGSINATAKIHLGPTGKPCLTVYGQARSQTVNPNIFNHLILVSNACSQPIKLQACYYHTQTCTLVVVSAYGRKEVTIGITPSVKEFRFEYKEQFDGPGSSLGGR